MVTNEGLLLLIVIALFAAFKLALPRVQVPLVLVLTLAAATVVAGFGVPLRHFVEGAYGYFNVLLVIFAGMFLLRALDESGALNAITRDVLVALHSRPALLLLVLLVILWFPGMVTGIGTAGVVSTGVVVGSVLLRLGVPKAQTAAIVALQTTFGAIAPPVCIPAMIIAGGVNMPYEGFDLPLLVLTVPVGVITMLGMALPHVKKKRLEELMAGFPDSSVRGWRAYLPLLVVAGLMTAIRTRLIPDLVTPVVFVIGALILFAMARPRISFWKVLLDATRGPVFRVVALLVVVGATVQVLTLTGVRGYLVVTSLSLSSIWLYVAAAVALPLVGGVLTHLGSASILGIPFTLAFLGRNDIVVATGLSLLCGLSQMVPPTALGGSVAAQVFEVDSYRPVLKASGWGMALAATASVLFLVFANNLSGLVRV